MKNKNFLLTLLSLIAGGLLILAFAPFHWFFIGIIAPALLLYCWKEASPKQAFWRGFLFGIGEFTAGTSWIYISIHNFGNATVFLAGLITALFILFMSTYPALQGYCFAKLFGKKSWWIRCCLAFPSTWVIFEILRSYLFTGFPWLALGYSQTETFLNGYAPLMGVFGISLLLSFLSGVIVVIFSPSRLKQKIILSSLALLLILIAIPLHQHQWTHRLKTPLSVALVQGNIAQSVKWEPSQIIDNVHKYIHATRPYWNKQLIIWPEASVPIISTQADYFIDELNRITTKHHSALLFGIPVGSENNNHFYNAIMTVGNGYGTYLKRHPVPFGEYTPLEFIFNHLMQYFAIPMSDLSKGPEKQSLIIAQHFVIATFICYEITYPIEVVKYSKGSQLLVTVNDDSWFGDSLAQPQQIEMAKMRSIETGRSMLYASNTGITAIIAPTGKIIAQAPQNQLFVLTGTVYPMEGTTPLMSHGFYPLFILVGILFLLPFGCSILANKSSNRRKNA